MRRFGWLLLLAICLIDATGTLAQTENTTVATLVDKAYDVESFAAELQLLDEVLQGRPTTEQVAELRDSLPGYWNVETPEQKYVISSAHLREFLGEDKPREADDWVKHMMSEVKSYALMDARRRTNTRGELDKILASNEFAEVHPPSAWDLFRQRLAAWVDRLLYKLFGGIGRYPIGQKILFWAVAVAALGFIALWLFRGIVNGARMDALYAIEVVSASRTWQEWIRMAREAAARKDFREAVHSAYWAGIARLEDTGVVTKDGTKTPREYLRMVSDVSRRDFEQRPTNYQAPLGELTNRLERIWYANRGAGPEDFAATLEQLQELGCRLE